LTGAIFLGIYVAAGVASGALAWSHVRRVAGAARGDLESIALALKRVPAADRVAALRDRTEAGTFERELAVELLAATTEEAKVSAVNLALGDAEHALVETAAWPRTALRIAILGAGICAFLAWVSDPDQLRWPLAVIGAGAIAALTCAQAQKTGERHTERQRRAIDALVTAVLALPPAERAPSPPGGAGGSAKRRRGRG
jgi:hypothetical protein